MTFLVLEKMAAAVDIRKIIYDATVNRKPDFLLGMDIKPFLDTEEKRNDLANTLLEQTFQGTIFILCMYHGDLKKRGDLGISLV